MRAALGLHPELVASRAGELNLLLQLLPQTRYVGEIGLDHTTPDGETRARQRLVFDAVLEPCARGGDMVLSIHSRRAARDVLGPSFPGTAILHWFSGSLPELGRAVSAGYYFSVNPAMWRSAGGRKLLAKMPLDRVLTESDGPFVRLGARPDGPTDPATLAADLAHLWGCPPEEAAFTVLANFERAVGGWEESGETG